MKKKNRKKNIKRETLEKLTVKIYFTRKKKQNQNISMRSAKTNKQTLNKEIKIKKDTPFKKMSAFLFVQISDIKTAVTAE